MADFEKATKKAVTGAVLQFAQDGERGDGIPEFTPRLGTTVGIGAEYADGRVVGAIETFTTLAGQKGIVIHEWSSYFTGLGHTVAALQWLRGQGYAHIVANGVGLVEDGVGDIATCYWQHMYSKGLVDELFDDEGRNITGQCLK